MGRWVAAAAGRSWSWCWCWWERLMGWVAGRWVGGKEVGSREVDRREVGRTRSSSGPIPPYAPHAVAQLWWAPPILTCVQLFEAVVRKWVSCCYCRIGEWRKESAEGEVHTKGWFSRVEADGRSGAWMRRHCDTKCLNSADQFCGSLSAGIPYAPHEHVIVTRR